MWKRFASAIGLVGLVFGAHADEVWSTQIGDVIYEADLENGMAVLSYPTGVADVRGSAYISGLAGVYTERGGYDGIWIEPSHVGDPGCGVEMVRPDTGASSNVWGRVKLVFVDPDYPGSWVALRGDCFDEPTEMLVGRPITASSE